MRFTQETDYALRLVLVFSTMDPAVYLSAREVADNHGIPYRFLLRMMSKLKRAGIITSRQGVDGGFRLAKPRGEITLKDVVEAIEGEVNINRCLKDANLCNAGYAPECRVHRALAVIQDNMLSDLAKHNFENINVEQVLQEPIGHHA